MLDHDCAPGVLHTHSDWDKLGKAFQGSPPGIIVSGETCSTFNAGAFILLPQAEDAQTIDVSIEAAMQFIGEALAPIFHGAGPPREAGQTTTSTEWARASYAAPLYYSPLACAHPSSTLELMMSWTLMSVFAKHCCFPAGALLPVGGYVSHNILSSSASPFQCESTVRNLV